jgi:hypothetical protein
MSDHGAALHTSLIVNCRRKLPKTSGRVWVTIKTPPVSRAIIPTAYSYPALENAREENLVGAVTLHDQDLPAIHNILRRLRVSGGSAILEFSCVASMSRGRC